MLFADIFVFASNHLNLGYNDNHIFICQEIYIKLLFSQTVPKRDFMVFCVSP